MTPGRRAPWKRWAEEGRGLTRVLTSPSGGCGENRPWETRVGAGNLGQPTAVVLQWSGWAARRPGQVEEAQEGKKWAGSWLTTKMEPTGSMVEDRTR